MLNFGLKHEHNRTWHKKFPRQKINRENPKHLGMHQHLRLRNEWFEGRKGFLSRKEINKFLEANIGRNVDEVFSKFVKRAKRYKHDDNLKEAFYKQLDPNYRWREGYSLDSQNRIVKVEEEKIHRIGTREAESFNKEVYPYNITKYLNETKLTYLGDFYIRTRNWNWEKQPVYICNKEWYDCVLTCGVGKKFVTMYNMNRIQLYIGGDIAMGVNKNGYTTKNVRNGHYIVVGDREFEDYDSVRIPYSLTDYNSHYVFLTKCRYASAY